VNPEDIRSLPHFLQDEQKGCTGCLRCVAVCPGLAITLVDFRKSQEFAQVSLPYELQADNLKIGDLVEVTNTDGESLGCFPVLRVRQLPAFSGTTIVTMEVPTELATQIAGLRLIAQSEPEPFDQVGAFSENLDDEAYICRCERVKAGEIRSLIRAGMRDINQIKALTRVSMGSCGGKTCLSLIKRLYQAEGIPLSEVTEPLVRPVFVEIPLSVLANIKLEDEEGER
jgi:ferredoxin